MHIERFKKISTAVMRYEELENDIKEIDHMAAIAANANITASFSLHVHEPERERETREAVAENGPPPLSDMPKLMAAMMGGMPKKCRCCHEISQVLTDTSVLKLLQVLIDDRRKRQREVERELMCYGIVL